LFFLVNLFGDPYPDEGSWLLVLEIFFFDLEAAGVLLLAPGSAAPEEVGGAPEGVGEMGGAHRVPTGATAGSMALAACAALQSGLIKISPLLLTGACKINHHDKVQT
jgi:hypothetical protein